MTTLTVMSRTDLMNFTSPNGSVAIISITDPGSDVVDITSPNKGILRLSFHDVDINTNSVLLQRMTEEQADEIADFCLKYWNVVASMIVQCEAGISRSAGVAAAISKHFFDYDEYYFKNKKYYPNRHCYRLVLTALREADGDDRDFSREW